MKLEIILPRKGVGHKRQHIVSFCFYEKAKMSKRKSRLVVARDSGGEWVVLRWLEKRSS